MHINKLKIEDKKKSVIVWLRLGVYNQNLQENFKKIINDIVITPIKTKNPKVINEVSSKEDLW